MSGSPTQRYVRLSPWLVVVAVLSLGMVALPAAADWDASQYIVEETNDHRADHGRAPLTNHNELNLVAQNWAEKMAQERKLYHNPRVGSQIPGGWSSWGENVAYNCGYSNPPARMMLQWKESSGHNENMLRTTFTHIGTGFYTDSQGCSWGVQVFARYTGSLPPNGPFIDVPDSHTFRDEIASVADAGIAQGYADGRFKPSAAVSRMAMAAFLHRAAGSPAAPGSGDPFPDVPASHPFATPIRWLADQGISGGYGDGTFRPSDAVTRQAMAAFLYRFAGEPEFTPPAQASFSDVPVSHPFFHEIEWLADAGISTGYSSGEFRGGAVVSRQAMAAFIDRFVAQFA